MNKWTKLGFVVLSLIVIIQTILLLTIDKKLTQVSDNENSHYTELIQNVLNVDSVIQNTLNNELSKTHLVKETSFEIDKTINSGYTLNVRSELSRQEEGSKVIFSYKDIESNQWTEIEMNEISSLSYTCSIDVSYDKDYDYKVTTVGKLSESSDIVPISKDEYMPTSPSVVGYGNDNNNLSITLRQEFYTPNDKKFKIKKIEALVKANNKEKSYLFSDGLQNEYNEYGTLANSIDYDVSIPNKDYKDNLEYIKVKITYENKIIDVRDITSEIDSYYLYQK